MKELKKQCYSFDKIEEIKEVSCNDLLLMLKETKKFYVKF